MSNRFTSTDPVKPSCFGLTFLIDDYAPLYIRSESETRVQQKRIVCQKCGLKRVSDAMGFCKTCYGEKASC